MNIQKFKSDAVNEEYTLAVLPNGLSIYIMEKSGFNSTYAVFGTKYGSIDTCFSINNGEKVCVPEGIAHFLEHKLFESEDGDAFSKYAKTGAYANAFTSFDRTCYLFSCSNAFEENLDILLDFVQSPYFTAQTVQKEQGIIGQEIRMYDDSPNWCVLFNMLEAMYHNNPVKIDIAGTVESISKIDHNLLYKCYNTFYNPANMFICIAGNVNIDKTLEKIANSIKPCDKVQIERTNVEEPEDVVKNYIEKKLDVALPLFCYGFKQPVFDKEPNIYDSICMNALLSVLAGDASALYKKLTDLGLINDEFDTEYFTGRNYAAVIFEGESKDAGAVKELINSEIKSLSENGISEELFLSVKKEMYGAAIKRYNSVENIAMMFIDSAISNYDIFEEIDIIKSLKQEDVEKYLSILNDERSVLSVILPR